MTPSGHRSYGRITLPKHCKGIVVRQVVVYHGEDRQWVAECASLPGCISQGRTRELALVNIKEAIEGYIAALEQDGLPVPEERFDSMLVAV